MHIMCMNCRARRCVGTVVHEEVGDGTKNLLSAGLRDRRAMRPTGRAVRTCGWVDVTCGGIKEAMASHDKEGATDGRRSRSRILGDGTNEKPVVSRPTLRDRRATRLT